jgi:hypothetical protein
LELERARKVFPELNTLLKSRINGDQVPKIGGGPSRQEKGAQDERLWGTETF